MAKLTRPIRERLQALFGDAPEAELLLERECGETIPGLPDPTPGGLERIRFAAIRVSGGDLRRLREAILLAHTDWRDLLVEAGFADDAHAHERWIPRRLDRETVDVWMAGKRPSGIQFGLNDRVRIRSGARRGSAGSVIALATLEPEPRYLVNLGSGQDVEEYQQNLEDVG